MVGETESVSSLNPKIMLCLTRHLNNPQSLLSQWFAAKQNPSGALLIQNHNQQMNRSAIIRPQGQMKDFALLGTAFVYAFRWHLGLLSRQINKTPASLSLNPNFIKQLLQAKTTEEKAFACLIFAAFEKKYRSGSPHELATVLMNSDSSQLKLKPELNYASVMVDDLVNLIDSLPSVWDMREHNLSSNKCFLNATFSGSDYIPADAQQIIDGMLIKCFTTLKKSPMSQQHFWQQIAYVLMDWNDEYQINKICWYYSRQKALFIYPIASLIKDLPKLRAEFHDFILDNFHADEDEFIDYFFVGKISDN